MAKSLNDTASNLTPETFSGFYSEWMEAKRRRESAVAAERLVLDRAKKAGVPIKAMKELEQERTDGSEAAELHQKDKLRLGQWMGMPLYTQATMFSGEPASARTSSADIQRVHAKDAGYETGKAGGERVDDNPFDPGTEQHVEWDKGYMEGQAWIAAGLGRNAKKADTSKAKPEPKPRGRKRKDPDASDRSMN